METMMQAIPPYQRHLKSPVDLVTLYEDTRAGFVAMALERTRRSTPFVEEARALKATASLAKTPMDLINLSEIKIPLLAAAGVSDKAAGHFQPKDQEDAVLGLIKDYLEPAGSAFIEELVYRFLLTRGDTLGGALRNVAGALAQRKVARSVLSSLKLMGLNYEWLNSKSQSKWIQQDPSNDADIELFLRGLRWTRDGNSRTLIFNLKVPFIGETGNNVDIVLFNRHFDWKSIREITNTENAYLAVGELKGGIDPAGADEHWKTAGTAFQRMMKAFHSQGLPMDTLFIGAAIETAMSIEIWNQLQSGDLSNAANLTKPEQLASIIGWFCSL